MCESMIKKYDKKGVFKCYTHYFLWKCIEFAI